MAADGQSTLDSIDIGDLLRMLPHRYPFLLVDRIHSIDGDNSAIGIKNVTVNEPHFQGHFPGQPVMPGVLIIEAMAQTAGAICLWQDAQRQAVAGLFHDDRQRQVPPACRARRPARAACQEAEEPRQYLEICLRGDRRRHQGRRGRDHRHDDASGRRRRRPICMQAETFIHPSCGCRTGRRARRRACGSVRSRHIGPDAVIGDNVEIVSHVAIMGATTIGAGTRIFPQAALGGLPQNAKHKGGRTTLVIGANCTIREGVTMHVGTDTSRGETMVGDNGNFLAYTHVAHDCIVGKQRHLRQRRHARRPLRDRRQRHHRRADGHSPVRADRRQRLPVRLLGDPRRRHSVRHRPRQPCQAARPQHHRHAAVGTAARRNPRGAARLSRRVRSRPPHRREPGARRGRVRRLRRRR